MILLLSSNKKYQASEILQLLMQSKLYNQGSMPYTDVYELSLLKEYL